METLGTTSPQSTWNFVSEPLFDFNTFDPKTAPWQLLGEQLIRRHKVLPLAQNGKLIILGTAEPVNQTVLNEIKFHTGLIPHFIIVELNKLNKLIEQTLAAQTLLMLGELKDSLLEELATTATLNFSTTSINEADDPPIIRYIHKIITDAIVKKASDIHFEPYENYYRIRLRIDGMLHEMTIPPNGLAHRITARLKIMAQLDITEHRLPQDGRCKIEIQPQQFIDLRVNTCPTLFGEKIVIRILDSHATILDLNHLGLDADQKLLFQNMIKKPHGLILVTGPTGSGKTISLYTALNLLNTTQVNILTIEDPIEIYLPGINQVAIHSKAGLTFATALRAFLRQDPDIIMVGEIRDKETAEIAIKAAQTGHLVLSTLHTNSAAETLTRLLNIGVAGYNIASSISLIIAQRLVRKLCPVCKKITKISAEIQSNFIELSSMKLEAKNSSAKSIYTATGCEHCTEGYQGRLGIFELLPITITIEQLILANKSVLEITAAAQNDGMKTLRQAGMDHVLTGITTLEEINRVTLE